MTHASCPGCRLRFTGAAAAYLVTCPECGASLDRTSGAEAIIGFRWFSYDALPYAAPEAIAVAMPPPAPVVDPA